MIEGTSPRRLAGLLLGSAGLNLFLAGALLPHLLGGREAPPAPAAVPFQMALPAPAPAAGGGMGGDVLLPAPAPGAFFFSRVLDEALPPDDAELLVGAAAPRDALARMEAATAEVAEEVRRLLKAEPFDAQALAAALARGSEARRDFEAAHQAALVEAVSSLSPEGRARLAGWQAPLGVVRLGPLPPPGPLPTVVPFRGDAPPGAIRMAPGGPMAVPPGSPLPGAPQQGTPLPGAPQPPKP
ncbi:MAG TPA: periplasmic heavy metal sensor [Azospirillaceae bacterium]|nr:periplasmic heavy metal sensor [Azospirillaceae bacterium]